MIILSGDRRGEVIPLKEDRLVIGRETGDLLLADNEVSSVHAVLTRNGSGWHIVDLGSTNGVWIDGHAYEEATLRDGADIVLGQTHMVLRSGDVVGGEALTDPGTELPEPALDLSWVHALAGDPGHTIEVVPESIYDDLTPTVEIVEVEAAADPEEELAAQRQERRVARRRRAARRAADPPAMLGPGLESLPPVEVVLELEGRRGAVFEGRFHQDAVTIGRDPTVDLNLEGEAVSARHCAIEVFPAGEAFLRDLGSTNGTFVNGGRVTWARLRNGDRITVGRHTLRFSLRAPRGG